MNKITQEFIFEYYIDKLNSNDQASIRTLKKVVPQYNKDTVYTIYSGLCNMAITEKDFCTVLLLAVAF